MSDNFRFGVPTIYLDNKKLLSCGVTIDHSKSEDAIYLWVNKWSYTIEAEIGKPYYLRLELLFNKDGLQEIRHYAARFDGWENIPDDPYLWERPCFRELDFLDYDLRKCLKCDIIFVYSTDPYDDLNNFGDENPDGYYAALPECPKCYGYDQLTVV